MTYPPVLSHSVFLCAHQCCSGGGLFSCCSKGENSDHSDDDHPVPAIQPASSAAIESYEGEKAAGKFHGHGRATFADGSLYDGAWESGVQHGAGRWSGPNFQRYVGQWENGEWNGEGKYTYSDMVTYTGQFVGGKMHGEGAMETLSGSKYYPTNH